MIFIPKTTCHLWNSFVNCLTCDQIIIIHGKTYIILYLLIARLLAKAEVTGLWSMDYKYVVLVDLDICISSSLGRFKTMSMEKEVQGYFMELNTIWDMEIKQIKNKVVIHQEI